MPLFATSGVAILIAPAFVLIFSWLCAACGRRLLSVLGLAHPPVEDKEQFVLATALGAGALQFVPFALAAFGQLGPWTLRGACLLLALALGKDLLATARQVFRHVAERGPRPPGYGWLLALLPALIVSFFIAVAPSLDADGLSYHLTLPKRWLQEGRLTYVPTYPHGNAPMGGEMLFLFGLVFGGDASAKLTHFALGLVGALGLFALGKRLSGPLIGGFAASAYLVGPAGVVGLLGWGYLEGITGLAIIASTLAWVLWNDTRQARWLTGAFLIAGISVSFKLTSALFPVGLTVVSAFVLFAESRSFVRVAAVLGTRALPVALVPIVPWLARAWVLTGNPLFPLFAKTIPSRDFSAAVAAELAVNQRYFIWGTGRGAALTLEHRQLLLLAAGLLACAAAAVAVFRFRSALQRGVTLALLIATLAQLSAVGFYQRYWIPVLAVAQLPVLVMLAPYLRRYGHVLLFAATALGSAFQASRALGTINWDVRGLLSAGWGVDRQRAFITRQLPLFPMYEHANRTLAPGAKVLLASSCAGFYYDSTTFCAEFFQDALRMKNWEEFASDMQNLGVTHIASPRKWVDGSEGPAVNHRDREDQLIGQLLNAPGTRLLLQASDQGLYEIDQAALKRPPSPPYRP